MVSKKFDVEDIQLLMNKKNNIRNLTVIAHVDHGKSTLTDTLVRMAGISSKERFTDATKEEQDRGISIESTGVSLYFELPVDAHPLPANSEGSAFLLNLIDSPGHVDFSSEVTAALRLTDGALVVVDVIEGVCVQTETVLRQALSEGIKPVLVVNKIDRAILELKQDPEVIYQNLWKTIESVNVLISSYRGFEEQEKDDWMVDPLKGNVVFGSGMLGAGFTIRSFARLLCKNQAQKQDPEVLAKKLWGDHFYDGKTQKWTKDPSFVSGRGFCKFILSPISKLMTAVNKGELELVAQLLSKLGAKLTKDDQKLQRKDLLKAVMPRMIPLGQALLEMVVKHLPSPAEAQQYRINLLYNRTEVNEDDEEQTSDKEIERQKEEDQAIEAMKKCDSNGPVMIYVSKMTPAAEGRVFAYGRVFSGEVKKGQRVTVLSSSLIGSKTTTSAREVVIKNVAISMGRSFMNTNSVPAGNTVCLDGLDKALNKAGTLTTSSAVKIGFKSMNFAVSPVVQCAVSVKNPVDLVHLVTGLRKLQQTESGAEVKVSESGENLVAGAGELHLGVLINKLRGLSGGIEIIQSQPIVSFCETVTEVSTGLKGDSKCLGKSPNGHNRLYATIEPMKEELVDYLSKGGFNSKHAKEGENEGRKKLLDFGFDSAETKKIWIVGPEEGPGKQTNILVDTTKGAQYMKDIQEHCTAAFKECMTSGVLCEEAVRGMRLNIVDVSLHSDAVHRGGNQIIPAMRKIINGGILTSQPRIVEPWYVVEVQTDELGMSGVYSTLAQRRGTELQLEMREGSALQTVKGYVPVLESFGLTEALASSTKGKAFTQLAFHHWKVMEEDPLKAGSKASEIVKSVRKRKGLNVNIPSVSDYLDKL
eukprot:TRINITY_DN788_c0_g1_i7.p1 TRINITY_DN788_c0_g1~~TRINITY_DN788_c0_g1_i7.p1  ORF type:complete len:870 (+),score=236.38 TRINITY_DN788_c0_g1_i7:334-2943(+)